MKKIKSLTAKAIRRYIRFTNEVKEFMWFVITIATMASIIISIASITLDVSNHHTFLGAVGITIRNGIICLVGSSIIVYSIWEISTLWKRIKNWAQNYEYKDY